MSFDKVFKLGFLFIAGCFLFMPGVYPSSDPQQQSPKDTRISIDGNRHKFGDDLGLSDVQKKALRENRDKSRKQMEALRDQMREKMEMIKQELEKDKFNTAAVKRINNEIKVLQARMLDERLAGILAVRNILTPEQFKKFIAKAGEMGDRSKDKKRDPGSRFTGMYDSWNDKDGMNMAKPERGTGPQAADASAQKPVANGTAN